jgi:hypothetical protein
MRSPFLILAFSLAACSSKETPATPTTDAAGTETATETGNCTPFSASSIPEGTATRAEVEAILVRSCALAAACHQSAPGGGGLALPAEGAWVDELVDKPSTEHKTMKRVVAGDPQNSFFIQKMTDGLCALEADCTVEGCGQKMPPGAPLPAEDFAKIVNWVRAGAQK